MARAGVQQLAVAFPQPVQCMAFRHDGQQVAVAAYNSAQISVWELEDGAWVQVAVLAGHQGSVSSLDWNADNCLASCGHGRTVIVWSRDTGSASLGQANRIAIQDTSSTTAGWTRQLLETCTPQGATCVSWSSLTKNKLAVGCAGKATLVVGHCEVLGWSTHMTLRGGGSGAALCLAWHPHLHVLAVGSTDGSVRLFHAFCPGIDAADGCAPTVKIASAFMTVTPDTLAWVHDLCWTPSGDLLTFATHAGMLQSMEFQSQMIAGRQQHAVPTQTLPLPGLPLKSLCCASERMLVGVGWGGVLLVFTRRQRKAHSSGLQQATSQLPDWELRCVLGRFIPGQEPVLAPVYLGQTHSVPSSRTPSAAGYSGAAVCPELPADCGRMSPGLLQRVRGMNLQDASVTPPTAGAAVFHSPTVNRTRSSEGARQSAVSPQPARGTSTAGEAVGAPQVQPQCPQGASMQAWEEVLAAAHPAHTACITTVRQPCRVLKQRKAAAVTHPVVSSECDILSSPRSGQDQHRPPLLRAEQDDGSKDTAPRAGTWHAVQIPADTQRRWGACDDGNRVTLCTAGLDGVLVRWLLPCDL